MSLKTIFPILSLLVLLPFSALAVDADFEADLARAYAPSEPAAYIVEFNDFITEAGTIEIREVGADNEILVAETVDLESSELANSL